MLERRGYGRAEARAGRAEARDSTKRTEAVAPISHAHARLLAYFWEEPERPDFAVTVLARTGAIRRDTAVQLERDLAALEAASGQSSDPGMTISERQVWSLLEYVQRHGIREEVAGWRTFRDDGEFVRQTVAFARSRRAQLRHTPRTAPRQHEPHRASAERYEPPADRRPTQAKHEPPPKTLYEELGGAEAVRAAVDLFYRKVLDDERLTHYFEGVNMARLKAHQRAMITAVAGGEQSEYADLDVARERLRSAHAHLRITRADFNAVATHLVTTLTELGVDPAVVERLTPTILDLRDVIVTVADVHPFDRNRQESDVTHTDGAQQSTIYDRIGGADAVRAAVDLFYRKVTADERINHHFETTNMARLKAHQRAMITAVAGGPNEYSGRSMHDAHAHLDITNDEFDTVVGHLVDTLNELGVPQEEIDRLAPPVLALRTDIVA